MTPIIEIEDLYFDYPDGTPGLQGCSLEVGAGERVAVLGANGAGKTTLALHLNGILEPRAGSVSIDGMPVTRENLRAIRGTVGIVFQDPDDQLFMPTVHEDVAFGPLNAGLTQAEAGERVREALATVEMSGHAARPPHHLSFGQRRRVALATVLSMDPRILVLDEPTSNLDPTSRRDLADALRRLDLTIVIVTHDLPYALELCPRSVVMSEGRIAADGRTTDVLSDEDLMRRNRLELPYAFDPALLWSHRA